MTHEAAQPVVIDTDPGIDDAIAILLALSAPELSVRGITTVAGNIGLETTTRNAGRLLALAGRSDIPVFRGAAAPLSQPGPEPLELHGADGLGGAPLPDPVRPPESMPAADWLADRLLAHPPGTMDILALGPLTNLARLVRDRPEAAARIRRVVAMGGTVREPGNAGPRSEFNLAADPEAADLVVRSGVPLVLVPLDVTRRVRATRAFAESLSASGRDAAVAVAALIDAYFDSAMTRQSRPLHDACVMLLALRPELFGCETLPLSVGTGAGEEAGALAVDPLGGRPVSVAMRVDAEAALRLLARRLVGAEGERSAQAP